MAQILYADELQTPELVLEFLEFGPHRILREPTYDFRMIEPRSGAAAGGINLRASHAEIVELYAGHIGYEVHEAFRDRRFALKAVEMLKPLALRLGLDPLWITCDPENLASRRICELAGGSLIGTVTVPVGSVLYQGGGAGEVPVPGGAGGWIARYMEPDAAWLCSSAKIYTWETSR